jgi:hypothetical protein
VFSTVGYRLSDELLIMPGSVDVSGVNQGDSKL